MIEIKRESYTLCLEDPTVYVDNEARGRSGHMTHAMTKLNNGSYINFNSNCSAERSGGHSTYGWLEYRFSNDSGKTYSEVYEFPYAKESFLSGTVSISVEKMVTCDNGRVIAFCLRNYAYEELCCEPWSTPTFVTSDDNCKTWSEPKEFIPYRGRIYDAVYHKGAVYVMIFCNEYFIGNNEDHVHRIYKSEDNGETFFELCTLPICGIGRSYCSLIFDGNDRLHAYSYNLHSEFEMDHAISDDYGKTWTLLEPCKLTYGARNPQTAILNGVFILHGRACNGQGSPAGFVIYTSLDGHNWDDGYLIDPKPLSCFYSNNINLTDEKGDFLLIQYSDSYCDSARVNVNHMNVRVIKND